MKMFINLHEHSTTRVYLCYRNPQPKLMAAWAELSARSWDFEERTGYRAWTQPFLRCRSGPFPHSFQADGEPITQQFILEQVVFAFSKWQIPSLAPSAALQLQINMFTCIPLITLPTKVSRDNTAFISNFIPLSSTCPHLPRAEFPAFIISPNCITLHLISEQSSSKDMWLSVVCLQSNSAFPDKLRYFALICSQVL